MRPGPYPIILEEGVGWTRKMTWRSGGVVVPLAAYDAILQVRHPTDEGVYLLTLTVGDGIVLRDVAPNIEIVFTVAKVDDLEVTKTTYRLSLTPPAGEPFPLLKDDLIKERW